MGPSEFWKSENLGLLHKLQTFCLRKSTMIESYIQLDWWMKQWFCYSTNTSNNLPWNTANPLWNIMLIAHAASTTSSIRVSLISKIVSFAFWHRVVSIAILSFIFIISNPSLSNPKNRVWFNQTFGRLKTVHIGIFWRYKVDLAKLHFIQLKTILNSSFSHWFLRNIIKFI